MSEKKDKEVFEGKIIEKDGKKVLLVQGKAETTVHPDGRKDVVLKAPSLSLVNRHLNKIKEKKHG